MRFGFYFPPTGGSDYPPFFQLLSFPCIYVQCRNPTQDSIRSEKCCSQLVITSHTLVSDSEGGTNLLAAVPIAYGHLHGSAFEVCPYLRQLNYLYLLRFISY